MAILTFLVIATIIIAGAYVGYAAWEKSLHEEPEAHSEPTDVEKYQMDKSQSLFVMKEDISFQLG